MGARTLAREAALQVLFAIDSAGHDPERALYDYWRETPGDAEGRAYADQLVRDVCAERPDLDRRIAASSVNWRLERMARVDRNVLRLATWELERELSVPRAVIIDEAVELAKRFGAEGSGAFVNGILTRIADDLGRKGQA